MRKAKRHLEAAMDIVLYYSIFLQMLLEWRGWPHKLLKWRQDLIFDQRFRAMDDKSENFVRAGVATTRDRKIVTLRP